MTNSPRKMPSVHKATKSKDTLRVCTANKRHRFHRTAKRGEICSKVVDFCSDIREVVRFVFYDTFAKKTL